MSNEPTTKHEQNYDECRFCDVPWSSHGVDGGPPLPYEPTPTPTLSYEPPDATRSYWQTKSNEPTTEAPIGTQSGHYPAAIIERAAERKPVLHLITRYGDLRVQEALAASRAETVALRGQLTAAAAALEQVRGLTNEAESWALRTLHKVAVEVLADITAAAQAYKDEVARAAVEPWRGWAAIYFDATRSATDRGLALEGLRALLAQSPAASDE